MSEIGDLVRGHYARSDLEQAILTALEEAGFDTSAPAAHDLFPIDQLHAGGAQSTRYLLEQLELGPKTRLLDIGCGIGGPSRMAAAPTSSHWRTVIRRPSRRKPNLTAVVGQAEAPNSSRSCGVRHVFRQDVVSTVSRAPQWLQRSAVVD